jgi:hypothetical protein
VKAWDIQIGKADDGSAMLTFPGGETVTLHGVSPDVLEKSGMLHAMGVPCFAAGTQIATPGGWSSVEDLAMGALVLTEAGPVPVLWHGSRHLDSAALDERPDLRPIRLRAGHYGLDRDLVVSPQHAIKVGGALIRARHLVEWGQGAQVARGMKAVTYHHILLPAHALVRANGGWAESFFPGREGLMALTPWDQMALAMRILGPQGAGQRLKNGRIDAEALALAYGPRCLPLLIGRQARRLLADPAVFRGQIRQPAGV